MASQISKQVADRLAVRQATGTEADIQSNIQTLLSAGDLNLDVSDVPKLEQQLADGTRRRIDVAICHAVIEIKKDLRSGAQLADAVEQLTGYVRTRREQNGRRFVGIASDGVLWILYDLLEDGTLVEISRLTNSGNADRLLVWLEAILTSQAQITPTPREIEERLGADSPAHLLDFRELTALYGANQAESAIAVKRDLWARLLRTAFGSSFTNDSETFINHTLLVLTAELIAHAVVGIDVSAAGPVAIDDLVTGKAFDELGIHGVVEADFFDWVLEVDGGASFVRTLADRVSRFDWNAVEHDVLKHLYESVITQASRASLGEYYTPDWLADRAVAATVSDPLNQRVLDPACGSGTFIFHAVRAYLTAAESAAVPLDAAIEGVTTHVLGMDIHPVAVTLARVTYLLAIGSERLLDDDRPSEFGVPVYLGDSLQWEQNPTLFSRDDAFSVATSGDELVGEGAGTLFDHDLVFPLSVLSDAGKFDRLVSAMADAALDRSATLTRNLIGPILRSFRIKDENDQKVLSETFALMRDLAKNGRDHIWGYYVRNLIRPVWLALPENKVDVLVGNPPWLRYSKMTSAMKARYKQLARPRNLLNGPLGASGRDLSTLFVVRTIEMYLKRDGAFAFVMPHGTLTRLPHTGFRSGFWASSKVGELKVRFEEPWDLSNAPTGFPMVSCVVRGHAADTAGVMPERVHLWSSTLQTSDVTWEVAEPTFAIAEGTVSVLDSDVERPVSPYKRKFRQGAILVPRVLTVVESAPAIARGIGLGAGRRRVQSRRTTSEKKPWRFVDTLTATVEAEHVYPVHLGETVAPFRTLTPVEAVLPLTDGGLMTTQQIAEHPGLASWWTPAEKAWDDNKVANDSSDLLTRINYLSQLSSQLPIHAERVVYTKSGVNLAAARVSDPRAVIDHKLYWAPAQSVAEGRYLTGILNSDLLLKRVRPLQNVGLFGPRDFDKNVFYVPFPPYDSSDPNHRALTDLVKRAETVAATAQVGRSFKATRRAVWQALDADGLKDALEVAVAAILPSVAV